MTGDFALSIIAAVGSFVGAVIVVSVTVGRERQRIDSVVEDVSTNKKKIDELVKDAVKAEERHHALRTTVQTTDLRHINEMAVLKATLDRLHEGQTALLVAVAEIQAAVRAQKE